MNEGERVAYDDSDKWCPGNCNAGARRKVRDYERDLAAHQDAMERWHPPLLNPGPAPEPPRIIPILGDPIFDQLCTREVKSKLARLDVVAAIAARESDGMRGATSEAKVSSSSSPASLSPTIDQLEDLEGWLRSWKAAVLGVDEIARLGMMMDSITYGVAWLVPRAERILRHPDLAKEFAAETLGWYARLERWDPTDVSVQRMPLRCPTCRRMTLERRAGEDVIRCRAANCPQGGITIAEYHGMVEQQAPDAKAVAKVRAAAKTPRPPADYGTLSGRA